MTQIEDTTAERTQRTYARLAGLLLLAVILSAFGGSFIVSYVAGSGTFAEKASRIAASEHLYRWGLSAVVISFVSGVLLYFALYVTLKPVNNVLAQLAMIFGLLDAVLGCLVQMSGFVRLQLYTSALTAEGGTTMAQALTDLMRSVATATENIGGIAFAIAWLLFFYLFFISRYIPKIISGLGLVAAAIWIGMYFGNLVFPELHAIFQVICFPPMGVALVLTGFWLLLFGVKKRDSSDSVRKEAEHIPLAAY